MSDIWVVHSDFSSSFLDDNLALIRKVLLNSVWPIPSSVIVLNVWFPVVVDLITRIIEARTIWSGACIRGLCDLSSCGALCNGFDRSFAYPFFPLMLGSLMSAREIWVSKSGKHAGCRPVYALYGDTPL